MSAATKVEPEVDAVGERLLEAAMRDAKNPVQEDDEDGDDEARFSG